MRGTNKRFLGYCKDITSTHTYKYVYESVYLCLYGNNNEWKENLTNGSIPQQFGYSQRVWKGIADVSFLQHFIRHTHTHLHIYTRMLSGILVYMQICVSMSLWSWVRYWQFQYEVGILKKSIVVFSSLFKKCISQNWIFLHIR